MNFNTPNNTSRTDALTSTLIETYCKCSWALPTNKMSNINSNFPLKINPPKLLLLNPIWTYLDFSKLLGHFWASVDHGSTVKDRGLRHFPMALRQKLWQPKEKLAKWKDGNECKCQLFFLLLLLTFWPLLCQDFNRVFYSFQIDLDHHSNFPSWFHGSNDPLRV